LNSQLEFRPRFFRGAKERGEGNKREKVKERIVESLEVILMKRIWPKDMTKRENIGRSEIEGRKVV
jgi:hypothetical protein